MTQIYTMSRRALAHITQREPPAILRAVLFAVVQLASHSALLSLFGFRSLDGTELLFDLFDLLLHNILH